MGDSPVFWFRGNDPQMVAAHDRARATFRYFWRELSWEYRRIIPALGVAAVKVAFSDGDPSKDEDARVEHMWVGDVTFDGRIVRGSLMNAPNHLESVSQGDAITVDFDRVGDWMYSLEGRVYGAFTVNLIRSRMSARERKEHDGMWGLDFGDPDEISLVPGGPKPGAFARLFGAKAQKLDPDDEHPMSRNMGAKLNEALSQNASLLENTDEHGLTLLHQLALAGSENGVRVALEHGASKDAQTLHDMKAIDLARTLGWSKVVALLE